MKKSTLPAIIVKTFFIAVFLNTVVTSAHILTATEPHLLVPEGFSFTDSLYIIALTTGLGVAIFALTSLAIYVSSLATAGMKRVSAFWLIMIIATVVAALADEFINTPLAKYNDQENWISMIAVFSIMVSLSSQYQAFIGEVEHEDYTVPQ